MSNFFQDIIDAWTGKRIEFISGKHRGEVATCTGAMNGYGGFGLTVDTDSGLHLMVYPRHLDNIKIIKNENTEKSE